MSDIQITEGTANGQHVGTFTRQEGPTTIHMQAMVAVEPTSGTPIPIATEVTLTSLKTAVDALSAKISACNTGDVTLDANTIAALQSVSAEIAGVVEVSNPGLTDSQLRATPVPVTDQAAETTLTALKTAVDALSAKITACNTGAVTLDAATIAALQGVTAAITGSVTVANPGLTDAQLRASPVAVTDPTLTAIAALHEMMTFYLSAMLEKMPRVDTADRMIVNLSDATQIIGTVSSVTNVTTVDGLGGKTTAAIPTQISNVGALHLYDNIRVN